MGFSFKFFSNQDLSNATMLIGPHGGAMGNMAYACRDVRIVEFIPTKSLVKRPCYSLTAGTLGLDYANVNTHKFDFDRGTMVVDLPDLTRVLMHK
jgi:capsular polysaccharide biosynthesis protein